MIKANNQSGLTLIELMISMVIAGMLLAVMVLAFTGQSRSYNTQQDISVLQEDMMAALQLMSRDIRMAGYNPAGATGIGVELANGANFQATQDLSGDGVIPAGFSDERILYALNGTTLVRNGQPVIDNITTLAFEYLTMIDNGPAVAWTPGYTQAPALAAIRAVKVCMQGRTARQTSSTTDSTVYNPPIAGLGAWPPALAGKYQWRVMCVEVTCRNLQ